MSDVFLYRVCNRCRNQLKYISSTYFKKVVSENPNECKYCKSVLDASLDAFKQGQYSRVCPQCQKTVVYKTRESYGQAMRLNKPCKVCSHIPSYEQRKKDEQAYWEPIVGRWNLRPKTFAMIKSHWQTLTEEQKLDLMNRIKLQKDYYWGHLRRRNRQAGKRSCREVFAQKYSGENHWMKRPEVLAKIRKSCEKYRGDGHWFRQNKPAA